MQFAVLSTGYQRTLTSRSGPIKKSVGHRTASSLGERHIIFSWLTRQQNEVKRNKILSFPSVVEIYYKLRLTAKNSNPVIVCKLVFLWYAVWFCSRIHTPSALWEAWSAVTLSVVEAFPFLFCILPFSSSNCQNLMKKNFFQAAFPLRCEMTF